MTDPRPFCHLVIPAPDLPKAKAFYEAVFGWRVLENVPAPIYWFFESGNVGGALAADNRPARNAVVPILRVDDLEATAASIEAHGGTMLRAPEAIGDADPGRDAYFLDPNGNEIGIYSGPPPGAR